MRAIRVLALGVSVVLMAGVAAAAPVPAADEQAIRAVYAEFTAAWNAHDPARMAACWSIDGDLREPDGAHARGRAAIEGVFAAQQRGPLRASRVALTIERVTPVTADVAMVDGRFDITGALGKDGQTLPPSTGLMSAVLVREAGTWRVAASRTMVPVPMPWQAP